MLRPLSFCSSDYSSDIFLSHFDFGLDEAVVEADSRKIMVRFLRALMMDDVQAESRMALKKSRKLPAAGIDRDVRSRITLRRCNSWLGSARPTQPKHAMLPTLISWQSAATPRSGADTLQFQHSVRPKYRPGPG